ncbi:helix-turn-helix domain-containing protein [Nocardia sp. BMG111209]|uniref:helix-turn-helix domain-containing protein n=1 Tax=Nocardia sp. BMG111209 TaxID=1160137 RepID=UPI00036DB661|nr:helix-turn-helix domain-containing protein [Nocardia sp. BMG111209]
MTPDRTGSGDGPLDIAEVARRSGVPASTLRFYEQKGLIASIGRRGQRRLFDTAVLQRLALIAIGRGGGFSLDEIRRLLEPAGAAVIDREMLRAKADELDRTIGTLVTMRDELRHAADCPAPSHLECPTFRRVLREVMTGTTDGTSVLASGRAGRGRPPAERGIR